MFSVADRINRWRHRHGFGVHSPAAFMLVREIINPGRRFRYYAEDRIDNMALTERQRNVCRIIIRLYGRFRPSLISLPPDSFVVPILDKEGMGMRRTIIRKDMNDNRIISMKFKTPTGEEGLIEVYPDCPGLNRFGPSSESSILVSGAGFSILYSVPGLTYVHVTV